MLSLLHFTGEKIHQVKVGIFQKSTQGWDGAEVPIQASHAATWKPLGCC